MINSKIVEELNKKYEEYSSKFDEYMEKMNLISSKMREIRKLLDGEFEYKDFKCQVVYGEIKYKSMITRSTKDNRKLYIFINNKLSERYADIELEYAKNNMLPGVVDKILDQEKLEREKEEKEIRNLKFRGLDYKTLKDIFFNKADEGLSISETRTLSKIVSNIIDNKDLTSVFSVMSSLTFALGIMEGKRQERARRKEVLVID